MRLFLTTEAGKKAGKCADTVRSYCEEGLLDPIRDSSGRRLFTDEDVKRIREIGLDKATGRVPTKSGAVTA